MPGLLDVFTPAKTRPHPLSREALQKDLKLFQLGLLDPRGFMQTYRKHDHFVDWRFSTLVGDDTARRRPDLVTQHPGDYTDPVVVNGVIRDRAFGMRQRMLTAVRRQHNLRTTQGRDNWQRLVMFGDIAANDAFATVVGNATATSATSLTNSGASFPTSSGLNGGLQGRTVYALPNNSGTGSRVYGIGMSNTGTVITVDQWYDPTSSAGAAGTTPNATSNYIISAGGGVALWLGLSTDAGAAAAGHVLRTADGLFADGTTGAAATEQTTNGLARAYIAPTFPGAGQIQLQKTFTYTGSSTVTMAKGVLCNSLAAAGSLLLLETLMSATAQVNSNGDNCQGTWTINL